MSKYLLARRAAMPSLFPTLGRDADQFQASIRRMFENPFAIANDLFTAPQSLALMPAVEISETDKQLVLTAELPGAKIEDVSVSLDDDVLTIRGEKSEERTEKDEGKKFHLVERVYGAFQRAFALPCEVDPEKVTAHFDKGVLTISMEKSTRAKTNGRKIEVTGA